MKKPRVVFPSIEAGLGHIMPLKAAFDAFEKKYGDRCEVIRSRFFAETDDPALQQFESHMKNEAIKYTKSTLYGYFAIFSMAFWGTKISSRATMEWYVDGACKAAVKHMRELAPDLVFSTHWSTNYYARKLDPRPLTVMYCPDAWLNHLFRYPADLTLISADDGYESALRRHRRRYNADNLKLVPFLIRNEAFDVPRDKLQNRRALGLPEDKFTVVLAEGGYGIGKMQEIVELLLKTDLPVTVVPVCGKNEELYRHFLTLEASPSVTFRPLGYCDRMFETIASADLFCGKSGNILAEPCFFGVPQCVTNFATPIEARIAAHYIKRVGSAFKQFDPPKVVDRIADFIRDPALLEPYRAAALKRHADFGAERTADEIWNLLLTRFPTLATAD